MTPDLIPVPHPVRPFDAERVRNDFPILSRTVYPKKDGSGGRPLVYLDNAATSQKPRHVIEALTRYYSEHNANVHRGVHCLSQEASQAYDDVRVKVQGFIGAASENEIVFTRGTTESINLVAATWGRKHIGAGDEILLTAMEHHSNIVPWQLLCEEKGAVLKVLPMTDAGELQADALQDLLSPKTKLVSIVHTSNSLGTINPVKEIIRRVRDYDPAHRIAVLVDGAQAVAHAPVDVADLDCDFFAFSGHKMLGPTGAGVLFGKAQLLESMPPYQGGGEMIRSVSFDKTTYSDIPHKFEAGTPNIADVIGLGAAIDYLGRVDRAAALAWENELLRSATEQLQAIPGVRLIGTARHKAPVLSFVIDGVNSLDAGMYLDTLGIAVRTGHHCTQPVMTRLGIDGTLRASFMFYNTKAEADALADGTRRAVQFLGKK